jgi:protoheme IX farnesyltransferase
MEKMESSYPAHPALPASPAFPASRSHWRTVGDYIALTKPRLNVLVVATSAAGYYLGATGPVNLPIMSAAVIGTALVAGGAAALNQLYERGTDALMRRTRMRPLPDGRIAPSDARLFGLLISVAGLILLASIAGWLPALLALGTLTIYLLVYTPLKRRSPAATLVGAVPGALPPLIGWAASRGELSVGGLALFLIVFIWQIPHFMAIAWMYRDDYRLAGFPMLPVIESDGRRTGRQAVTYAAALLPASLLPVFAAVSGPMYAGISGILSVVLLALAINFAVTRTDAAARRLFFGSIIYLPLIWIAMIADKL